jgi:hypothetical protein
MLKIYPESILIVFQQTTALLARSYPHRFLVPRPSRPYLVGALLLPPSPARGDSTMADQHEVDLDSVIDRLLEVRGSRPGKQVQLLEAEIRYLCTKAREIFISQPILLELEAPIKVWVSRIRC